MCCRIRGLLGIALARRPTIAMGVVFMIAAQIGISFIQFARMPSYWNPVQIWR
jgi:hypothetical protein